MATSFATTPEPQVGGPREVPELDDDAAVLAYVRECRAVAHDAEVRLLLTACTWAERHPAESIHDAAWMTPDYLERPLPLAGEGAPLVAEFAVAELAAALGMSTDAGRVLLGDALELRHRLPRHWARVAAGELPTWRARKITARTKNLSREAADHVDRQLAAHSHKVGLPTVERLVSEAVARFMPEQAAREAEEASDGRHVRFHHARPGAGIGVGGTTYLEAELDVADARDLDAALSHRAAVLAAAGCDRSLDVRRAMAAGELARHDTRDQLALDLATGTDSVPAEPPAPTSRPRARQVVLHVHVSAAALGDEPGPLHLARLEEGRRLVTADQVRSWCRDHDTHVVVRPVVDLDDHQHVEAYEVPDRLRDQAALRDHACVFPWCTRPARACDCDHVVPHAAGGPTCSCNLAPLCRRHHRLKTHATWSVIAVEPGTYLWRSPHGYQFLRDLGGTRDVTTDRPPRPPRPWHPGGSPPASA